jgi:hypothetical protein
MEKEILISIFIALLLLFGCTTEQEPLKENDYPIEQDITISEPAKPIEENLSSKEAAKNITIPLLDEAINFAKSTSTYGFDGKDLQFINYSNESYEFVFNSSNSGYGNRSSGFLDEKITGHTMQIKHNGSDYNFAVVDSVYDEIHSILLKEDCPVHYKKFEWINGSFCYRPSQTDEMPCVFSKQCEKGGCKSKSDGKMGPRGICSDYMYGCNAWLYDQTVTRVDICKEKDYPG